MDNTKDVTIHSIQSMIYTIRGLQVMLDSDLAEIYQVETKILNRAVKRNIERFPESFRFQLTENEYKKILSNNFLRFQNDTLKKKNADDQLLEKEDKRGKHRKYSPYVFTEQGVSMLSAVLRSETAIKVSIQIINAFVGMRKFIFQNANLFQRINNIEQKQIAGDIKQLEASNKIDAILDAIEERNIKPTQGIFFEGQIFDAYCFLSNLIKTAKHSIIVIDNYVDESVFTLLLKRKKEIETTIFVKNISKQLALDLKKHNEQYDGIVIKEFHNSHDRFLILDNKDIYHFGASLKDLGKKWFAFSKLDIPVEDILNKLK
ncbi:MAG: ORF6N domain-containing protein [Candidatus Marinimicrobia bacterium]|nr:ORF6N domain-containing protein [Candidatus Neomarinimicrobiota bacterium]